jgi:ABC-type transport system substrate-binding protein
MLNQPVAIFPYIMAETFNIVVPKAVVSKETEEYFASNPVGTGPFMLQSWQKGVKVVFVRNPYYFRAGKQYLDKVTVYLSMAANVIALKVEKGELTGFGVANELSAADLQLAKQDPKLSGYLVSAPTIIVTWLDLNTHDPLLSSPTLRQAVAMAINRRHLVRLLGGLGIPANQFYIPLDPQYDKSLDVHPIYPYDPTKAAALLKKSGYHGQPVEFLYSNNQVFDAAMAPGIEQDLKTIGLNVTFRGVAHTSLLTKTGALTGHQLSDAFWGIDFPDGYDIYSGELACNANTVSGSAAHFCDPQADNLVNQAEALSLGKDRDALLQQAQIRILRSASKVPLTFLRNVEMVSPKLGGYYYHAIFAWQFENYWLKH